MLRLSCVALLLVACDLSTSEVVEPLTCDVGIAGSLENACVKASAPAPLMARITDGGPPLRANEVASGVRLVSVGGGMYRGNVTLQVPQAATFAIYLSSPNIPFQVVESDFDGGVVPTNCSSTITNDECKFLRRVHTVSLAANQHVTLEIGPTTVSYVRVYAQTELEVPPVCSADQLTEEEEACTATEGGATVIDAMPLVGATFVSDIALDEVYVVRLPSIGGTYANQYAGKFRFFAAESGTYELYRGTPNIPMRVIGHTIPALHPCTRYIPSTECDLLRRGERFELGGGKVYEFELGPAANPYVRVTLRRSAVASNEVKLATTPIVSPSGSAARYVTIGDLDGDGMQDLAVSSPQDASGENWVYVHEGDNTGTFAIANIVTGVSAPAESVIDDFSGDVSGDDVDDIIVLAWDGQGGLPGSLLVGNPAAPFTYSQSLFHTDRESGHYLDKADFLLGNQPEIVVAWADTQQLTGGGFRILEPGTWATLDDEFAFGADTRQAVAGDFNGDGFHDVIAASRAAGALKLYYGDGQGGVTFAADIQVPGDGIRLMESAQLGDGTGASDLVTVHNDGTINILRGSMMGLSAPQTFIGTASNGVGVGDFNHDGLQDIALSHGDHTAIQILVDTTVGQFQVGGEVTSPSRVGFFAAGDVNGDGFDDLVAPILDGVAVWLGTP